MKESIDAKSHSVMFKIKHRLFFAFEWLTIFKAMDQFVGFVQ